MLLLKIRKITRIVWKSRSIVSFARSTQLTKKPSNGILGISKVCFILVCNAAVRRGALSSMGGSDVCKDVNGWAL